MKIFVTVKTGSKERGIERIGENEYVVRVKSKPIENMANTELVEVISDYFKKPKSAVRIVSGQKSKKKILEIA